jgi:hypothetical protein
MAYIISWTQLDVESHCQGFGPTLESDRRLRPATYAADDQVPKWKDNQSIPTLNSTGLQFGRLRNTRVKNKRRGSPGAEMRSKQAHIPMDTSPAVSAAHHERPDTPAARAKECGAYAVRAH